VRKGAVTVLAVAAAAAAFWPAAGSAATATGVVVAKQHGVLLVASPSGALHAVRGTASLGSRLLGTRVVGHVRHATIRGVVVRRVGRTLVLSSNRHLIAIPNRVGRVLAADAPAAPTTAPAAPGAVVTTDVTIQNGHLEEDDESQVGQVASGTLAVQATVKGVGTGTVTLDVQGQSITVPLPGGLTLPASLVGQTVTLNLSLSDDEGQDDQGDDDHGGSGGGDD
jgi:hypothetical protein